MGVGHHVATNRRWAAATLLVLMTLMSSGIVTGTSPAVGLAAGVATPSRAPASPGPTGTPVAAPATGTPAAPGTPTSGTPAPATPAATPSADLACTGPCLVRFAASPGLDAALAGTGLRPSYATATAIWVGGTPADLGSLVSAGAEPIVVLDDTPSLMLYAVTQAAGDADTGPIDAFGDVIDREGMTSIVEVPSVPAVVVDLTGAGFQVEKVTPYVSAGTPLLTADSIASLPDVTKVTEAFPDLSSANIEQTIGDLVSTGVTPGEVGSRFFSLPGNSIAAEYLYLRYAAFGLTVWYEDYIASNGMLSINVVAEIPGTDQSEIYAVFAHYDSITDDVPDNDTAPGALDNGTGQAIMLENARLLSGYRLRAPIRFVALDGEEVGLQGSVAFGARHAGLGTPIVGGINVDSAGSAYGDRVLYVNASETSAYIQDILLGQYDAFGFQLNVQPRQNPAIVADETVLTQAGIPTIFVGSSLYGDPLINCTCDTIDGVDIDYVRATGRLMLMTFAVLTAPPE